MANVEFIGRTLPQIQAQALYDWLKDPRGELFWTALKEEMEVAQEHALSLKIEPTLHPVYAKQVKDEECGKVQAYRNMFSIVEYLAENISLTHDKQK
jgi:hypothetical protein